MFIHVPKTAGTSLITAFGRILGPNAVSPTDSADGGFAHVRLCKEFSLEELCERRGEVKALFNDAVWRFAGLGRHGAFFPDETVLPLACERIASCDFVGMYEELADSMGLMSYTFGWPPVQDLPHQNVTDGSTRLQAVCPRGELRVVATANGTRLQEWLCSGPERQEISAFVPARIVGTGTVHVVFRIDQPISPAEIGPSSDPCALGAGFDFLEFRQKEAAGESEV